MRTAVIDRKTAETDISLKINIDGTGVSTVNTGIGFLDHMLTLFAKHSKMDLEVRCKGDIEVDYHHTVEDIGIVLGKALYDAMGDKRSIKRYSSMILPMDETLVLSALDVSGRPYIVYEAPDGETAGLEVEMFGEFFRAVAFNAGITLHIKVLSGTNAHHVIEAIFKSVARSLREALETDARESGIPSTKGVL